MLLQERCVGSTWVIFTIALMLLLHVLYVVWYLPMHWCCCRGCVLCDIYQCTNVVAGVMCCVIFTIALVLLQESCVVRYLLMLLLQQSCVSCYLLMHWCCCCKSRVLCNIYQCTDVAVEWVACCVIFTDTLVLLLQKRLVRDRGHASAGVSVMTS